MLNLARTNYVTTDERGAVVEMFCKNCGTQIGLVIGDRFSRLENYAELKLRFSDGTFHVTNICAGCIEPVTADPARMQAIHDADIDYMALSMPIVEIYKNRSDPRCVGVDTKQRGIT